MDTTPLALLAPTALIVLVFCIGILMLIHASERAAREHRDASIDRAWAVLSAERRTAYLDQSSYDWSAEAEQERMDAVHESRAQRRG